MATKLKEFEHQAYAQERAKQVLMLDTDDQWLAPCAGDIWKKSEVDATPFCWRGLFAAELSVLARSSNACDQATDCVVVSGLDYCSGALITNRLNEKAIADRAQQLRAILPTKRFVAVKCHGPPMIMSADCIDKKCVAFRTP